MLIQWLEVYLGKILLTDVTCVSCFFEIYLLRSVIIFPKPTGDSFLWQDLTVICRFHER